MSHLYVNMKSPVQPLLNHLQLQLPHLLTQRLLSLMKKWLNQGPQEVVVILDDHLQMIPKMIRNNIVVGKYTEKFSQSLIDLCQDHLISYLVWYSWGHILRFLDYFLLLNVLGTWGIRWCRIVRIFQCLHWGCGIWFFGYLCHSIRKMQIRFIVCGIIKVRCIDNLYPFKQNFEI